MIHHTFKYPSNRGVYPTNAYITFNCTILRVTTFHCTRMPCPQTPPAGIQTDMGRFLSQHSAVRPI